MAEATNQMTEVLEQILNVPDTPTETEAVETTDEIPQEAIEAAEQTEEVEVEEARQFGFGFGFGTKFCIAIQLCLVRRKKTVCQTSKAIMSTN